VLALFAFAAASLAHARKGSLKTYVAIQRPRSQARLRRGPVAVRISTSRRARLISATLNGASITSDFDEPSPGAWTLSASPNYGLRHGANVLRVTAVATGHARTTRTARFRVTGSAPLAAAGRDMTVALGTAVHLNGLESLAPPVPRRRRGAGGRLKYMWTVVRAPPPSDAVVGSPDGTPETAGNKDGETRRLRALEGSATATPRGWPTSPAITASDSR
jgi:hypothetical protein